MKSVDTGSADAAVPDPGLVALNFFALEFSESMILLISSRSSSFSLTLQGELWLFVELYQFHGVPTPSSIISEDLTYTLFMTWLNIVAVIDNTGNQEFWISHFAGQTPVWCTRTDLPTSIELSCRSWSILCSGFGENHTVVTSKTMWSWPHSYIPSVWVFEWFLFAIDSHGVQHFTFRWYSPIVAGKSLRDTEAEKGDGFEQTERLPTDL